jgi:hypothetical protein
MHLVSHPTRDGADVELLGSVRPSQLLVSIMVGTPDYGIVGDRMLLC